MLKSYLFVAVCLLAGCIFGSSASTTMDVGVDDPDTSAGAGDAGADASADVRPDPADATLRPDVPDCEPVDEVCDGLDNDCDGEVDEGVADTFYRDEDADGFGAGPPTLACAQPQGFVQNGDDCDDQDENVSPGGEEVCDGLDNDCDPTTSDAENPECEHTIFVSSRDVAGDFNFNAVADDLCEEMGVMAGGGYGRWRAVISTPNENARDRIVQIGAIRDTAGNLLWNAEEMFTASPLRGVTFTERNERVGDFTGAWTGSDENGTAVADRTCQGFMSADNSFDGTVGHPTSAGQVWDSGIASCNASNHIYCINGQP